MMKYFQDCTTEEAVKSTYRKLAFKYHPDKGGSSEAFSKLQSQYETAIYNIQNGYSATRERLADFESESKFNFYSTHTVTKWVSKRRYERFRHELGMFSRFQASPRNIKILIKKSTKRKLFINGYDIQIRLEGEYLNILTVLVAAMNRDLI